MLLRNFIDSAGLNEDEKQLADDVYKKGVIAAENYTNEPFYSNNQGLRYIVQRINTKLRAYRMSVHKRGEPITDFILSDESCARRSAIEAAYSFKKVSTPIKNKENIYRAF